MMNPGTYYARFNGGQNGTSRNGSPNVVAEFTITHQAIDDQWVDEPEQPNRTVYISMSDNAVPYSLPKLKLIGAAGDLLNLTFSKVGESFTLECKENFYEGKTTERWDFPQIAREVTPPSDDVLRRLSAVYKNFLDATRTPDTAPPAAPPQQASESQTPGPDAPQPTDGPPATNDDAGGTGQFPAPATGPGGDTIPFNYA